MGQRPSGSKVFFEGFRGRAQVSAVLSILFKRGEGDGGWSRAFQGFLSRRVGLRSRVGSKSLLSR